MNGKRNSGRSTGTHGLQFLGAAIMAIGLTLAVPAQAVNIVTNGGFETGDFTGWTLTGNTGFMGVTCPGAGLALQGNCDAFAGPVGSDGFLSQVLNLIVGQRYVLTFLFQPDGGTPSHFDVSMGGIGLLNLNNPAASGPRSFSFFFLATLATETLSFSFRDDPGFLFLDAVSVSLPEPASVGLLGVALLAMVVGLRRKAQ